MSDSTPPTREHMATLASRIFALVLACPAGRVTTYGWLAKAVGYPRGARMVGWIMSEAPAGVPAQRVISSKGELTGSRAFGQKGRMRQLLEAEGITFSDSGMVDLKRYGWDPAYDLSKEELEHILGSEISLSVPVNISSRLFHLLRNDPASPLREVAADHGE